MNGQDITCQRANTMKENMPSLPSFFSKTKCHEWAKQKMPEGKHNSKEIVNMNKYPRAWGGMQYTYILSMYINAMCYLLDIGIWNPI